MALLDDEEYESLPVDNRRIKRVFDYICPPPVDCGMDDGMWGAFSDAAWYGCTTNPSNLSDPKTRFVMPMLREA